MKAILIRAYGEWRDVMRLDEVNRPSPVPGEVLVEVHGVNYRTHDLIAKVAKPTDGRGVDFVFRNISDPTLGP
jgi:NADPH:quinone reductase-like Zn-dependent oxidoreductase